MMKYNILYIHNKVDISGGERSLINLWKNIDKKKFNLFLILPVEGELSQKARECGLEVFYSQAPKLVLRNIFSIFRIFFIWFKFILKNRIHLIHSYAPRNNILSGVLGRMLSRPVIWHERNMIYDDKFDVTRKFLFLPKKIICNSGAVAERFRKRDGIPAKVKVIYNGVDLDIFNPVIDASYLRENVLVEGKKVIGVVTNLSKRKRVEFFLEASARIKEAYDDAVFIVVGGSFPRDDTRMTELKEKTKSLGIEKSVIFTGFQENTAGYISLFDISVNVTEKEACSRAIIESLACGKAVVAMSDGGTPELITSGVNGILTDSANIKDFCDAIVELLGDDKKRAMLGDEARKTAEEKFNVRKNAEITQDLYEELIH